MKVGVYVDGYNLYYGARETCGRGTPGWRWLDIRALANKLIQDQGSWTKTHLARIVYCTARVDARLTPSSQKDQDVYLKALKKSNSVDWIEYGRYVTRAKTALLATTGQDGRPQVVHASWPVKIRDAQGNHVKDASFIVKYLHVEEKGSDVNVASHLLLDVLERNIDAAMVISNDSDLAWPIREARKKIPVATVNPRTTMTAGALQGSCGDGVGNHWWRKIDEKTYKACQLPDPCGSQRKPVGW